MTLLSQPAWLDIALRLGLTFLASGLMGLDRGYRGHAAGLRTTVLVGLAAGTAMLEANLLLATDGRPATSYTTMDVMRLPLGVLTGVGFIGGGVILKRGDSITGVTTAATLWIVTAIGLCFGAGQIGLGCAATALGFGTLAGLKWIDRRVPRKHEARLVVAIDERADLPNLSGLMRAQAARAELIGQRRSDTAGQLDLVYELSWVQSGRQDGLPGILSAARGLSIKSIELTSRGDV